MRNRWFTMDLAEDEDFAFKHPYFFENFTFKFECLHAEIQKELEHAVKSMSAKVSDDAEYILTDIPCSDPTKNYYSVSYLSESILAEKPLDIEDYKFSNLVESAKPSNYCCDNGTYIWRTNNCKSYFNHNAWCISCIMADPELKELYTRVRYPVNEETSHESNNEMSKEPQRLHTNISNATINGLQCDGSSEKEYNASLVEHEIDVVNLDKSDSAAQPQTNGNYQENRISNNNTDPSDFEMVEVQKDIERVEKPSCSTQKSKVSKTKEKSSIDRWKKKKVILSESDSNSDSEELRKRKKSKDVNLDENSDNSTAQLQANGNSQENGELSRISQRNGTFQENGIDTNNSDLSDLEMVEVQKDVERVEKPSCSTQKSKDPKTKKKSGIDRWVKRKTVSRESDSDSGSENLRKQKKTKDVNLDENSDDSTVQPRANGNSQENGISQGIETSQGNGTFEENRINTNNSDSSDIEMVEVQKDIERVEKPSCSTQKSEVPKTKKKSGIDKGKRKRLISSESDSDSERENLRRRKKTKDAHLDENSNDSTTQQQANGNSQENGITHGNGSSQRNGTSQQNRINNNRSDSSDIEVEVLQKDIDIEKPSCSTQKSKDSKTKKKSGIDRWKKTKTVSRESDSESGSEDLRKRKKKDKKRRPRSSSSSSEETITTTKHTSDPEFIVDSEELQTSKYPSESSSDEESELVERTDSGRNKWWLKLPPPNKSKPQNNIHLKFSKREYDHSEKRIMIAYLVVNDLIHLATSRKPWVEMLNKGYLQGRSVESISNHFRKTILPKIESFNLPKNIEKDFKLCRKQHQNRR